jgi:hypothetical protein
LAHSFEGFKAQSVDPVAFRPVVRQHNMVGEHGEIKPLISWSGSKKENEEGAAESHYPFQRHNPNDLRSTHKAPPLKGSTTSQYHYPWGTNNLMHELLRKA